MTFDSKSLEQLNAYGEKLAKDSLKPNGSRNKTQSTGHKLHPIETEEDPKKLFKELIKASRDGSVPSHLIKRLKELEDKQRGDIKPSAIDMNKGGLSSTTQKNQLSAFSDLYTSFKMLLLEEE